MFLLNSDEKISFLKVVYSVIMFDDYIQDEEKVILESLQSEVFNLASFQKINLETDENIANEINKITKVTPIIHLFNILFDLSNYYKQYEISNNSIKEEQYKEEYNRRIDSILERVKYRDEIKKSKLFDSLYIKKDDDKSLQKNSATIEDLIMEQLSEGSEILAKSTKNIFDKLFK